MRLTNVFQVLMLSIVLAVSACSKPAETISKATPTENILPSNPLDNLFETTKALAENGLNKGAQAYDSGDYATALREWRPLAEQGDKHAQIWLGVMYANGKGVIQDYKEAVKWYGLAAAQGNATAQFLLGGMYDYGEGVIQDNVYAHMWLNIAASSGVASAGKNRDIVAGKMTAADISKAQDLARECVKKEYKGC